MSSAFEEHSLRLACDCDERVDNLRTIRYELFEEHYSRERGKESSKRQIDTLTVGFFQCTDHVIVTVPTSNA